MLLNTTLIILAVFVIIFLTIAGIDIYKSKTSKKNQIRYNKKLSISAYLMLLPAVAL